MSDKFDKKDSGQASALPNEHLVGLAEALFEKYCKESFGCTRKALSPSVYIEHAERDSSVTDSELLARMHSLRASLSSLGYELPSLDEQSVENTRMIAGEPSSKFLQ